MPHSAQALSKPSNFDEYSFRKAMNKKGAAYRNQAIGLIGICLSFSKAAEQSFAQDAELSELLQVCDETLLRAAAVPTDKHPASGRDFDRAIRKLLGYLSRHPSSNITSTVDFEGATQTLLEYESRFHSPDINKARERMRVAKKKDQEKQEKPQTNEDPLSKVIKFQIMQDLSDPQPTFVRQVLKDDTRQEEVIWNFFRFDGEQRLTLSQNPHFYNNLPTSTSAKWHVLDIKPTEGKWHTHHDRPICVLTNTPGRVFLELTRPRRAFHNVWKMGNMLIFKCVDGKLEGEFTVKASILQSDLYSRFHVEVLSPLPGVGATAGPPNPGTSPTNFPACVPVEDLNDVLRQVLHSPDIKILIKGCGGCT